MDIDSKCFDGNLFKWTYSTAEEVHLTNISIDLSQKHCKNPILSSLAINQQSEFEEHNTWEAI